MVQKTSKTPTTRARRLRQASRQRREREKEELRETILEAAGSLFLAHGYEAFSLRQVAEEIGYSPGTIYLYFRDKDELLFTVAEEGFAEFGRRLGAAAATTDDPQARLAALARAYVNFGLENPAYYQLMFIQRTDFLAEQTEVDLSTREATFQILLDAVTGAIAAGTIRQGDPLVTSDILWSLFHGIVSLALRMPQMFDEARTERAVEAAIEMARRGLEKRDA